MNSCKVRHIAKQVADGVGVDLQALVLIETRYELRHHKVYTLLRTSTVRPRANIR
jgi:hypothetical protein